MGPAASADGKLKGEITPNTPYGRSTEVLWSSPVCDAWSVLERVVLDEPVAVVRDEVGALLHLADRLDAVLADLERHDGAEEHDALADQVGGALQDPRALRVGRRAPVGRVARAAATASATSAADASA